MDPRNYSVPMQDSEVHQEMMRRAGLTPRMLEWQLVYLTCSEDIQTNYQRRPEDQWWRCIDTVQFDTAMLRQKEQQQKQGTQ